MSGYDEKWRSNFHESVVFYYLVFLKRNCFAVTFESRVSEKIGAFKFIQYCNICLYSC